MLLLIFAAAFACAQALQLQYILQGSGESSEEEYSLVLPSSGKPAYAVLEKPNDDDSDEESSEKKYRLLFPAVGQHQPSLSGVPIFQTVKVKVPRYGDSSLKQQLFAQALAARGINVQDLGIDPLTRSTVNLGGVEDLFTRSVPNLGIQNLGAQLLARSAGPNYGGQDYGAQLMARLAPNSGAQDLGAQLLQRSVPNLGQNQVYLIRKQRQVPTPVKNVVEVVSEGEKVDSVIASNAVTVVPAVGIVTKPPIVDAVVASIVSPVPVAKSN